MRESTPVKRSGAGVAHTVWAAVNVIFCVLLVLTGRKGHPPAVILLPLALAAWALGHGFIWGVLRLAAVGRRKDGAAANGQSWPFGLKVAAVCTAAAGLLGVVQVVGTVLTGGWYPFQYAGMWAAMLLVWLIHAGCFVALMLRRGWSRWLSSALAFGWAALLGVQLVEHLIRSTTSDIEGVLIAVTLIVSLVLLGSYLLWSGKARSFLGE